MTECRFKTDKGEVFAPQTAIFPITSPFTSKKPYRVIGTGFLIQKPGIFLTARHCLYNEQDKPWTDLTCMVHHPLGVDWLIDFAGTDLAIGQIATKDSVCEQCKNHKVLQLSTWQPKQSEVMFHWGCDKAEIQLLQSHENKDYLEVKNVITGYKGKFEEYHPSGVSVARWPCYRTSAEFPNSASGGPVSDATGRVFAINSTSSEGGGYSTAVLIKNVLESNVPGHYLINDGRREQDMTFGDVLRLYGAEVLEE